MNHPTPQPTQTSTTSTVEMTVFVVLFLWIASLPSNQLQLRHARSDRHLASRLSSQFDSWMHSGFHGTPIGPVYRHLHACIVEPE